MSFARPGQSFETANSQPRPTPAAAPGGPTLSDEAAFLRNILATPADDAARLAYADWLQKRGDDASAARARFLRVTSYHAAAVRTGNPVHERYYRWLKLEARKLDADWLRVVCTVPVENCVLFAFDCPKWWDTLTSTDNPAVRSCDECQKTVHYCATVPEARESASSGRCVAVQLGLSRTPGDLELSLVAGKTGPVPDAANKPDAGSSSRT
jgi:uncharacterized protein (TIGR02996 family)